MDRDLLWIEHSAYGVETFCVGVARFNVYRRDDGRWELVLDISTSRDVSRSARLEEMCDRALPHIEASLLLHSEPALAKSTVIVQQRGYDAESNENLTQLFYFGHESIEEMRVELVDVANGCIDADVSGLTIVNGSNKGAPDAKFCVRTRLVHDVRLRRSFA
jgi:hypothetical protein